MMAGMKLRFLITGGAGFLGINLVRDLLARGHSVVSLDIANFDYPEKSQIEEIRGDIRDYGVCLRACQNVDIVVHCAAALANYTPEDIDSIDVEGTRNVLSASESQGVARVIHISSTAVYGIPDHHPLVEQDRLHGLGPYGRAKVEAERVCLEARGRGMCVPILRPKSFIGPERLGIFGLLYDWAYTGHGFPVLGTGSNRYQLLDVADLCEAIYLASTVEREKANETFNIGASDFGTMKSDFQAVLDRAGYGKRIIAVPAWPAIVVLRLLDFLKLSPVYAWVYETAAKESEVSIARAQAHLGFVPKLSNKDALLRNYDWYLANVSTFQNQTGLSHRTPWKQGVLSIVKRFF